ncbi:hypothetical protein SAMN05421541_102380 [Actinoplanes philippinensis]|uniref:Uncharacterized protein n=1 Tax=Actinoplanes philippinensis TaxID=35752 RepID=A0A1I2BLD4_9ACTN|nr:hypothetical protein [Actinoplanes philippinensis]SFE56727.1 hypothetical protein SAMN05421541_102380 [Actinoplanes philippinensis]
MGPATRMRAVLVGFGAAALRLQIMTGVALAAIGALVVVVFLAHREAPAGEEPGDMLRVGVVEGQSVSGYLRSSRDELARLRDAPGPVTDTWALVAFNRYAAPGELPGMLAGAQVAEVYTRVPMEDARTPVLRIPVVELPADVTAGMAGAARARDREQADYQRLGAELSGDGRTETRLRTAYASAARLAAQEAAAYREGCECVFAAVVRATPAVLDGISARPWVRVVDPAPEVRQLDRTEFRPPLPEEVDVVAPDSSAVPSPVVSVASTPPAPLPSSIEADVTSASPDNSGGTPSPAVFPSDGLGAVPSAADASPAHDGAGVSPGASSGDSGR